MRKHDLLQTSHADWVPNPDYGVTVNVTEFDFSPFTVAAASPDVTITIDGSNFGHYGNFIWRCCLQPCAGVMQVAISGPESRAY